MLQGDKSVQIRTDNIKSNSFVNDFELIKESLEYYSNLYSNPKKCMVCPEVVMDVSDLSDNTKKVKKKKSNASNL